MSNENQELEGFICPICYADLGSMLNLRGHFETCHPDEDTAIVDQIKGLFGKAKKFLGKEDPNTSFLTTTTTSFTHTIPPYSEHQELGIIHSHTDTFKQIRDRRVDRFSMQTNNLLNRIDKLLSIDPSLDDNKKKELEKSLVAWASDSDTTICMTCGHRFNLTRRRHHCRLCGCVICASCSCFLSRNYARKLATTTTSSSPYVGPTFNPSSNGSNDGDDGSSASMRCCSHCRFLLERREEQIQSKTLKPSLVVLYENIKGLMAEADDLVPEYCRAVASLSEGENSRYSDAAGMKSNINEVSQRITYLLKKLSEEEDSKLRNVLTQWASWYVQEKLLASPRLPSEEEVEKVKMMRKKMTEERIANERKLEEIWREKYEDKIDNSVNSYNTSGAASGTSNSLGSAGSSNPFIADIEAEKGWLPDKRPKTLNPFDDGYEEDPLLQQIQNIERYIKQAERDKKYDEMRMLKENLKLLHLEYQKQV